jgi:hypothetical protein
MEDKKFTISGMVENIDIPDDEEEKEEQKTGGFRFKLNKDKINDFLRDYKQNKLNTPMPNQRELDAILRQTGMSQEEFEKAFKEVDNFFKNSITPEFIEEIEKLSEKKDNLSQKDVDNVFDNLFKELQNQKQDEDDFDDEEDIELEPVIKDVTCSNYEVFFEDNNFGVVKYQRVDNIYDAFKRRYGNGPSFEVSLFTPEIVVSNAIEGLREIKFLEYIEHNDKFILFKGIPLTDNLEPIILAMLYNDNKFEMVVPEYGNSFDVETGLLYDKQKDKNVYIETPDGPIFTSPYNMDKIKVGLDVAFFEEIRPILSIADFGRVIPETTQVTESGMWINFGKIQSNESPMARMFKRDFDIDLDKKIFDFYIKVNGSFSFQVLNKLKEYLGTIDFNTNLKIQTYELKAARDKLFIEMDLGMLPNYITKWENE